MLQTQTALEREDIQGLLLSAYGHLPWSANMLLRIDDAAAARAWLRSVAGIIADATTKQHRGCANIAFTYPGLTKLGVCSRPETFPDAFRQGMSSARRAHILGDTGSNSPDKWLWGVDARAVDVLLMLFAHTREGLDTSLAEQSGAFAASGLCEIKTLVGQRHSDGREHFGFSDGISQPAFRGARIHTPKRQRTSAADAVEPGEFILGYRNGYELLPETPKIDASTDPTDVLPELDPRTRDLGRNGSYLVVRQLEQDVARFWNFCDRLTRGDAGSDLRARERLAAKVLGRWPSGAPLVKSPDYDDHHYAQDNDFGFAQDRAGLLCPIGSHVRRANPRDGFGHDSPAQSQTRSNRHRLLRRGRPYGPRIKNVLVDDGAERGLIFICLNSDIERQFEFVQQTWLNNPNFCGLRNEIDPLVGVPSPGAYLTIPREPVRQRVTGLEQFVRTRGGAYFFLPGLRALRYIASATPHRD